MQRVSTAFVGQVSAASSPAIAKLKGRARATNDPAYVPLASSHRAQSRRRRDPGLDLPRRTRRSRGRVGATAGPSAQGRRIDHGGRGGVVLACSPAMDLELLVKIEGEARRAVRALNLKTAAKRGPTFVLTSSSRSIAEVGAGIAAEEAAGRPGILHQWHSSLPSKPSKPGFGGFEGADP